MRNRRRRSSGVKRSWTLLVKGLHEILKNVDLTSGGFEISWFIEQLEADLKFSGRPEDREPFIVSEIQKIFQA